MKTFLLTGIAEENKLLNRLETAVTGAMNVFIAVSFISDAGLKYLFKKIERLLNRWREVSIFTSGYLAITEPEALDRLLFLTD